MRRLVTFSGLGQPRLWGSHAFHIIPIIPLELARKWPPSFGTVITRSACGDAQITLNTAKTSARVGAIHGIAIGIHRPEDQGTWGLAREDARESARHHTRSRPCDRGRVEMVQ